MFIQWQKSQVLHVLAISLAPTSKTQVVYTTMLILLFVHNKKMGQVNKFTIN